MPSIVCWARRPGPGRLGVFPHPLGDDDLSREMDALKREGVDVIVSMLTAPEVRDLGLEREAEEAGRRGILFLSHPVPDHEVPPAPEEAWALARALARRIREGASVAVHCFAGIGRSTTLAACVLRIQGCSLPEAWAILSDARGFPVPDTAEQRDWPAVLPP